MERKNAFTVCTIHDEWALCNLIFINAFVMAKKRGIKSFRGKLLILYYYPSISITCTWHSRYLPRTMANAKLLQKCIIQSIHTTRRMCSYNLIIILYNKYEMMNRISEKIQMPIVCVCVCGWGCAANVYLFIRDEILQRFWITISQKYANTYVTNLFGATANSNNPVECRV